MRSSTRWFACLTGVCIAMTALAAQADPPRPGYIDAVWKPQSVMFDFRSEGRLYPCDVLEHKIKIILHRLGAHDRLQLRSQGCRDLGGRARFEALLESPIEATTDNVRELTRYDSEDELIARIRGEQLPSAVEMQRFAATWESISFRSGSKLDIDAGDCALVQQLRKQIMTKMSIQVTRDIAGVDCAQELSGISGPRLTVVALVPVDER